MPLPGYRKELRKWDVQSQYHCSFQWGLGPAKAIQWLPKLSWCTFQKSENCLTNDCMFHCFQRWNVRHNFSYFIQRFTLLLNFPICCIFQPANSCCTACSLVEICFFIRFSWFPIIFLQNIRKMWGKMLLPNSGSQPKAGHILTTEWAAQHLFANQNIQHPSIQQKSPFKLLP